MLTETPDRSTAKPPARLRWFVPLIESLFPERGEGPLRDLPVEMAASAHIDGDG